MSTYEYINLQQVHKKKNNKIIINYIKKRYVLTGNFNYNSLQIYMYVCL